MTNGSSTPTRAAENAAVTYLSTLTDPNPKFIVLATDGQPNCPASGTGERRLARRDRRGGGREDRRLPDVRRRHLGGRRTRAGAEPDGRRGWLSSGQPGDAVYPVSSTAEFAAVLRTLVATANTCMLYLPPPPTNDGTTSRADIEVKGTTSGGAVTAIPQDATDGWTYADAGKTRYRAARRDVRSVEGANHHDRDDRVPLPHPVRSASVVICRLSGGGGTNAIRNVKT